MKQSLGDNTHVIYRMLLSKRNLRVVLNNMSNWAILCISGEWRKFFFIILFNSFLFT